MTVDVICPACNEALTIPMALNVGGVIGPSQRQSALEMAVSVDITTEGRQIMAEHCSSHSTDVR